MVPKSAFEPLHRLYSMNVLNEPVTGIAQWLELSSQADLILPLLLFHDLQSYGFISRWNRKQCFLVDQQCTNIRRVDSANLHFFAAFMSALHCCGACAIHKAGKIRHDVGSEI